MITEKQGQFLHDKAVKGELLSETEKQQLKEWYAYQDEQEMKSIQLPSLYLDIDPITIQNKIENVLFQLAKITENIKQIITENEKLRRENANLRHQLASYLKQVSL